jgi:hypothetical protein
LKPLQQTAVLTLSQKVQAFADKRITGNKVATRAYCGYRGLDVLREYKSSMKIKKKTK